MEMDGDGDSMGGSDPNTVNNRGKLFGTSSADGTVKIWDFETVKCRCTFSDHSQVVWAVIFHDAGDFAVSCSIDHTAKMWDLTT